MKLQYYLRGLGIGILVTAMIFCVLPGEKESLSDDEIRARAVELGMVESSSLTLADIQSKPHTEQETQQAETQSGETQPSEAQPDETQPSETQSDETQSSETQSAETQPTETQSGEVQPTETQQESTEAQSSGEVKVVSIVIPSGADSYTVSKQLEEKQLIENAGEFDAYLCNNGYSRSIRVGTYEITMGATWEEIARKISGK